MTLLLIIAKALFLILLATLLFLGIAEALDAKVVGASERFCVGQPLTGCFLTII